MEQSATQFISDLRGMFDVMAIVAAAFFFGKMHATLMTCKKDVNGLGRIVRDLISKNSLKQ